MFQMANLADLPEFGVGHAEDIDAGTGCTVFTAPDGAICGVDVRGGGPATRETDLLKPENMIEDVHAVVLSGGSAFGLEAACGVMETLVSKNIGFRLGSACVPIVPSACLFDLLLGKNTWPNKEMGAKACIESLNSRGSADLKQGNVGAGCGATVGKMGLPTQAMKSGFGYFGLKLDELVVIACVAVNACGNIIGTDGNWIAGPLSADGEILDPFTAATNAKAYMTSSSTENAAPNATSKGTPVQNTTLGVILTNANITKAQATKVAQIAQDGYARAITPVHTLGDGDTIFVMASKKINTDPNIVGIMAAQATEQAIRNAVINASSAYGLKAARDLQDLAS